MIIEPLPGSSIETQYSSHSTAAGRPNLKAAAAAAGHLFAARFCYLVFTLLKRLSRFPKLNLNRLGRFGPGIRPFYFGLKVGIWEPWYGTPAHETCGGDGKGMIL